MFGDCKANFEDLRVLGVSGNLVGQLEAGNDLWLHRVHQVLTLLVAISRHYTTLACHMREDAGLLLARLEEPVLEGSLFSLFFSCYLGKIGSCKTTLLVIRFLLFLCHSSGVNLQPHLILYTLHHHLRPCSGISSWYHQCLLTQDPPGGRCLGSSFSCVSGTLQPCEELSQPHPQQSGDYGEDGGCPSFGPQNHCLT